MNLSENTAAGGPSAKASFRGILVSIITLDFDPCAEQITEKWNHARSRYPKLTLALTCIIVLLLAAGAVIILFEYSRNGQTQQDKPGELATQIAALKETQSSLKSLGNFIEVQQEKIELADSILQSLEEKRQLLQPLVDADQVTVDSLFHEYDLRATARRRFNTAISFVLGVVSSMVATFLCGLARQARKRKCTVSEVKSTSG